MKKTNLKRKRILMPFKAILLLVAIFGISLTMHAQVTIGLGDPPEKGALLQIKDKAPDTAGGITATSGGLLFPRVNLTVRGELYPFYAEGASDYVNDAKTKTKLNHIGLMVYNLNTVESENLETGLYKWDGEKWAQIMETPPMAKVEVEACSLIRVNGKYYAGVGLNTTNTISLPLKVTQEGNYTILATTANGFQFQAAGVFKSTGNYTVTLTGIGTPVNTTNPAPDGTPVVFVCNEEPMACNDVKIPVGSTLVNYDISCGDIKVYGQYSQGESLNTAEHYVVIPIVVNNAGKISITTSTNNGFYFSGEIEVDVSMTSITLRGYGIPIKAGTYPFNFSTNGATVVSCNFSVKVETTLGTFDNPAKNCFAILSEDPTLPDGEYWIQQSSGSSTPVKTMCDMTHGGYTLIWSYSEYTTKTKYTPTNEFWQNSYALGQNIPQNVVQNDINGVIMYDNYRLDLATMKNIKRGDVSTYRVRIVYDPVNVTDAYGENNYFVAQPASATYDYLKTSGNLYAWYGNQIATTGKIFGLDYKQNTANMIVTYAGYPSGNNTIAAAYYGVDSYGIHWDIGSRISSAYFTGLPTRLTAVVVKEDGTVNNSTYKFNPQNINNLFGYHGETEINHHWGKCGSQSADDYDFTPDASTATCNYASNSKFVHNFNYDSSIGTYQGRYLQWWIK